MSATLFLRLFVPFAFGNFMGAFYRAVTAVVGPEIVAELGLTAEDIGLLISVVFLFYAGVQIPLGMLLDRFGARPVTAILFAFAGVSALLFATSSDFATLMAARALMGIGISAAFMGGLKAMVEQVPREKLAMSNSMIMASGGVGLMSATYPVQIALNYTDWRGVFVGTAIATFMLTAAILWLAPKARQATPTGRRDSFKGVIQVFTNREFLRYVPLGSAAQGVNMAMSGLWAGPWLRDVVGLTREQAATVLFGMATSISLSVLVIGWVATRLARAGFPIIATACCGMAGFIAFESLIIANVAVNPFLLWVPYAACATAPTLIYAVLANSFSPDMAGRVNTAYNFTTFTFAFAVQWFMGAIIDLWPPVAEGRFAPEGYRWGFAIIVGIQLCAFVWLALAPKVYARR